MNNKRIQKAIAYFRNVKETQISSVYIASKHGDKLYVNYRGPKGRNRTAELDLSKQYMKMWTGDKDG